MHPTTSPDLSEYFRNASDYLRNASGEIERSL